MVTLKGISFLNILRYRCLKVQLVFQF